METTAVTREFEIGDWRLAIGESRRVALVVMVCLVMACANALGAEGVFKDGATNRITEDLKVPSGRTLTIESGGTLTVSGTLSGVPTTAGNNVFTGTNTFTTATAPFGFTTSTDGDEILAEMTTSPSQVVISVTDTTEGFGAEAKLVVDITGASLVASSEGANGPRIDVNAGGIRLGGSFGESVLVEIDGGSGNATLLFREPSGSGSNWGQFTAQAFGGNRIYTLPDASGTVPVVLGGSAALDFASTAAQTASDLTISVTGAAVGDVVSVGVPHGSVIADTAYSAWVSAADTVTVRLNNFSSSAADPSSGTFRVMVIKF